MLRVVGRVFVVAMLALTPVVALSTPGFADGGIGKVKCDKQNPQPGCDVDVGTPARPGDGGGGNGGGAGGRGGDGKCRDPQGQEIPCQRDGGWAGVDGCYYKPADLSPTIIENLGGQPSGAGGWYEKVCYGADGQATTALGGPVWIAGAPPAVSPEILARQARAKLRLPEVTIRMNPPGAQLGSNGSRRIPSVRPSPR